MKCFHTYVSNFFEECLANADVFEKRRGSLLDGVLAVLDGIAIAIMWPKLREASDPPKY